MTILIDTYKCVARHSNVINVSNFPGFSRFRQVTLYFYFEILEKSTFQLLKIPFNTMSIKNMDKTKKSSIVLDTIVYLVLRKE